ncbi:PREDICTED: prokineticin receptor 2-like [Branchiostoma belcheri]|uniref:Prokineticin receptor 2-like n=1 Tax=Branchiostoma belcheri TaxID=7741 RepID=A0A6P5AUL9_BRABE|nr:PREDICTED: prokineticin receptor 2-like [Branchiostoma belcheri]
MPYYPDINPNNNTSSNPVENSFNDDAFKIAIGFLLTLIMLVCGVGNFLLMVVIARYKQMRTVTNLLIANLSLSDFLVALLCVPFIMDYYVVRVAHSWQYGDNTCMVVNFVRTASLYVSTNALLVIALDRYVCIMLPHVPRMSVRSTWFAITAVWLVSMLLAIPAAIYSKAASYIWKGGTFCVQAWPIKHETRYKTYYIFVLVCEFILPVLIMSYCYIRIACKIWNRSVPGHHTQSQEEAIIRSKRRGVRLLIIILILFVLCWGPFYGYAIVRDFFHDILSKTELNFTLHFVMESLAMSNSMINTIVYTVMNDNVRKYAKKLAKELRDKWRNRKHRRVGVNPVNTVSTIAVAFENGGRSSPRGPRRAALFGPGDPGRVVPRAVGPRDVLGQADRGFQYREGRRTGQGHRTVVAPLEMRTHSELSSVEMV